MAEKLKSAVAVINDFDPGKRKAIVAEASAVLESFGIPISPAHIPNRAPFETALKKGKGITEAQPTGTGATELRELWTYLDHLTKARAPKKKRAAS